MKFFLPLVVCLLLAMHVTGQVNKVYIDRDGKFLDGPKKAAAYLLVRKLSDSDYSVQKYDLRDTILLKGEFKDMALTRPIVRKAPEGTFFNWMKEKGKLGGQHKVPRLANDREYLDSILLMMELVGG